MKLFKVYLKGLHGNAATPDYGLSFVVAEDPTSALKKVQEYLSVHDYGFEYEREMDYIELVAEEGDYPDCGTILFL